MKKQNTSEYQHIMHTFEPLYTKESEILILGSLPSVQSRTQQFYYGHPQNRFWKVLAAVFHNPVPASIEEKKVFLQKNHIALWDVIASCDIVGSSDSSIKNVKGNDIRVILENADIKAIYLNGGKAYELFMKYCISTLQKMDRLEAEKIPNITERIALEKTPNPSEMLDSKKSEKSAVLPKIVKLPSTSPANAAWSLERLTDTWRTEISRYAPDF